MSANARTGRNNRAAPKKREVPAKRATGHRNTARPTLTTPKINKNATLLQSLETSCDEEDEYDETEDSDDGDETAIVTPREAGRQARRKRGDSVECHGASDDEIKDDDEVEPSNASTTKFTIKKHRERATEVEENAVAYMAARVVKFVKNTLFKMVKFISDDELGQIAMGLVMKNQKIPPSGRKGFSNQYMKLLLETLNKERGRCQQEMGYIVLSEF
jgi:hypothetical protein